MSRQHLSLVVVITIGHKTWTTLQVSSGEERELAACGADLPVRGAHVMLAAGRPQTEM